MFKRLQVKRFRCEIYYEFVSLSIILFKGQKTKYGGMIYKYLDLHFYFMYFLTIMIHFIVYLMRFKIYERETIAENSNLLLNWLRWNEIIIFQDIK